VRSDGLVRQPPSGTDPAGMPWRASAALQPPRTRDEPRPVLSAPPVSGSPRARRTDAIGTAA